MIEQNLLEGNHYAGGLLRVGTRADFKVQVGAWNVEVFEKRIAHRLVVVLTGVDEQGLESSRTPPHFLDHRRYLHEVRPGADDVDYSEHALVQSVENSGRKSTVGWSVSTSEAAERPSLSHAQRDGPVRASLRGRPSIGGTVFRSPGVYAWDSERPTGLQAPLTGLESCFSDLRSMEKAR